MDTPQSVNMILSDFARITSICISNFDIIRKILPRRWTLDVKLSLSHWEHVCVCVSVCVFFPWHKYFAERQKKANDLGQ